MLIDFEKPANRRKILLRAVTLILAIGCSVLAQQVQLQITAPAPGTVVNPGQTVSVSVSSPSGTSFSKVAVIGEDPLGSSGIASSVPSQLSVSVPASISPGMYMLTAVGTTTTGNVVQSPSVLVYVERADAPTSISASPPQVFFRSSGQHVPLRILATFSDGSVLGVSRSSLVTYVSSNVNVATVDKNGIVTAIAKGSASITATYTQGAQNVHVVVQVTVPPPVLAPSPTALSFNSENVGTHSAPLTTTITNVSSNQGLKVGPVIALGDFSETDNCATSSPIVVGGMCTINVTFTPTVAGSRTGAVSVSDSMDIVPLAIPLSGTGIAPPSISNLNPTSGSVGTSVTITGVNFGGTQGSSTVTFNGTAGIPTSWSDTSIAVPVPSGATTGNVVVTVGGVASNAVSFTVGNPPVAYVQGNSASQSTAQTTVTAAYSAAQTAGNLNVVVVDWWDSAPRIQSVTDTKGNTYALAVGPTTQVYCQSRTNPGTTQTQAIYYAKNVGSAAANTVTVTFTAALASATLRIAEYSGLDTANPLDVSVAAFASTQNTTASSGSVTTTNAHDLLIAADLTDVGTISAGAGYTSRILNGDILEDMNVKATGSYNATATLNVPSSSCNGLANQSHYVMQMVALRAAH